MLVDARMVGSGLVGRDFASRGETVAIRDPLHGLIDFSNQ